MTPPMASSPLRPPRRSALDPPGESGADAPAGLAGGADAGLDVIVPAAIVRVDGLPAPAARAAARSGEIEMLPVGPEAWLAVSADLGPEVVQAAVEVAEAAGTGTAGAGGGGAASCTDLTHARTMLRVSGPHARARLARGCPLDLDTLEAGGDEGEDGAATTATAAAATLLGPFEVVIRRVPTAPDAFDVFVPRSMARSARAWLAAPAAPV